MGATDTLPVATRKRAVDPAGTARDTQTHKMEYPHEIGTYTVTGPLAGSVGCDLHLAECGPPRSRRPCIVETKQWAGAPDAALIDRFLDLARNERVKCHPNVLSVLDVGEQDGQPFAAYEHVEACSLGRLLDNLASRSERLATGIALDTARQIADGLASLHERTVPDTWRLFGAHDCLGRESVIVTTGGELKLAGAWRMSCADHRADAAVEPGRSSPCRAPETYLRGATVDRRADLYALGVLLFELLTGRPLFGPRLLDDRRYAMRRAVRGLHPLPSDVDPALEPFDELVIRNLDPDPARRYQRPDELRAALERARPGGRLPAQTATLGELVKDVIRAGPARGRSRSTATDALRHVVTEIT